jgi:putative FmdB family regulatory protein
LALGVSECQQLLREGYVPTYQYACTACGHQLEAVQSFAEDPLTECPACTGRLRKLYSSVGIVFKGSGFYRTDSRGKNGDGDSSPKSDSKTDSKTDSTSKTTPATGSESTLTSKSTSEAKAAAA